MLDLFNLKHTEVKLPMTDKMNQRENLGDTLSGKHYSPYMCFMYFSDKSRNFQVTQEGDQAMKLASCQKRIHIFHLLDGWCSNNIIDANDILMSEA
jgi:hypothetical protein